MRLLAPFLLILPFVLSIQAEYGQCTEYDEAHPIAKWTYPPYDLAPPNLNRNMQYVRTIPIDIHFKHYSGETTTKTFRFDIDIDFTNRGFISASRQEKDGPNIKWKFNLLNKNGLIAHSFWLNSNDACFIPQGPLNDFNGKVSFQAEIN